MFTRSLIAAALVTGSMGSLGMSAAQAQVQNGLVTVSIGDVSVLNNFLNGAQIAALNNLSVPVSVQVPVGVAANVCNVSAAVLAHGGPAGGTCQAKSGSQALAQAVNRQLLTQSK